MLYDNIMVPYDGSASAQAALAEAVRYAKDDPGLSLHIVQIVDTERLAIEKLEAEGRGDQIVSTSGTLQATFSAALEEAEEHLRHRIAPLVKGLMNKVTVELVQETSPGDQIVSYAVENNCDLIVMGSRGLGAIRGILGSVSSFVLRNADMPVLVVKENANE